MKRVQTFFFISIVFLFLGTLNAETVMVSTDYTTPADILGDLVVINGSVDIPSGDLIVRGDVKVSNGSVLLTAGKLRVFGDLIVTNTLPAGNAIVYAADNIDVSGAIITDSMFGDAHVSTTAAPSGGNISAESIQTKAYGSANVAARLAIDVIGDVRTKSTSSDARVVAIGGNIYAGNIATSALNDGYVDASGAGIIYVKGMVNTEATNGSADVFSKGGMSIFGDVTIKGGSNASVENIGSGDIKIFGSLNATSTGGYAVVISVGNISAGAIVTNAYVDGYVRASGIEARGDIVAKSLTGDAHVYADTDSLYAVNVTTSAYNNAYVKAMGSALDVKHNINTFSSNGAAYVDAANVGALDACNIFTNGYLDSHVSCSGNLTVNGAINTKSVTDDAYVSIVALGDLNAGSISTDGAANASLTLTALAIVKDEIKLKGNIANVFASGVTARSIETNGVSSGYVSSATAIPSQYITVENDIRTSSSSGDAYVLSPSGAILARSVKVSAANGSDGSIKSYSDGKLQLFANPSRSAMTIKDTEFFLDRDHDEWKTAMSIEGTCTLNGNGHKIVLSDSGGFFIKSGGKLLLKNILVDKVGTNVIRGQDNTITFSMMDVALTQTADTAWSYGSLQISGVCAIEGIGTNFSYDSSATSTIHKNGTLLIGDGVRFVYSAALMDRIVMLDSSSRFHFDGGSFRAATTAALLNGTAVFDRDVLFEAMPSKTIYFGNGDPADELGLEFHLRSRFGLIGTFTSAIIV